MRMLVPTLAAAMLTAAPFAAQTPEVSMKIVSPGEESFVSGPVLLRVLFDPPARDDLVAELTFFVDGRLACRVVRAPFECAWDTGPGINEHVVRAVAVLRDGRRLVQNVRTKGVAYADRVDVNVVQVTATVTDSRGRFVSRLTRDEFRVFEDDVRQEITYFAAERTPLEVVVAIDVSSSMGEAMPTLKEAVKRFLVAMEDGDEVTLLAFNDTIFTLARRETTRAGRTRAVDRLTPWGGTALYDVIIRALDLLGRQQGRRALVVFTDGEDQSSHATLDDVIRRVEASDATVYMIGQGRGTLVDRLKAIQERLARVSGGRAFQTDRIADLEVAFGEIVEELSNQYLLAYPPTNDSLDDSWREIRVEIPGLDHRVRARQGYRATPRP